MRYFSPVFENYYVFSARKLVFNFRPSPLRRIFIHRNKSYSVSKSRYGKHSVQPPYSEKIFLIPLRRKCNEKESAPTLRSRNLQKHKHRRHKKSQHTKQHKNKKKNRIKHKKAPRNIIRGTLISVHICRNISLKSVERQMCNKKTDKVTCRFCASRPVSRVLSFKAIICLGAELLLRSRHLSKLWPSKPLLSVLLRIGFTGHSSLLYAGELLPRLSTLTCYQAVYLCCTFP